MQTDTPSFTEHSAPPFHIRLPVAAGRPAWVPHLLRCLQAHGSRPGASLQPGDTIPTGAPLDLARSALSGCVMAPHPDRPDQILVVGVTGAERFMAQRISTDRLLEVVRTVEPDLIADVRRGCFVGDPRTAEALAGSATVPPPACVPTSLGLDTIGWFSTVFLDPIDLAEVQRLLPSLLATGSLTLTTHQRAVRIRIGGAYAVQATERALDIVLTARHVTAMAREPVEGPWFIASPDPTAQVTGLVFAPAGQPITPAFLQSAGARGRQVTFFCGPSFGCELVATDAPRDALVEIVDHQPRRPLVPGTSLVAPPGWTGRFTVERTSWQPSSTFPVLEVVAHDGWSGDRRVPDAERPATEPTPPRRVLFAAPQTTPATDVVLVAGLVLGLFGVASWGLL